MRDPERLDLPSASSFARTVACHGWIQLAAQIPEEQILAANPPNADADRGTRIHKAFETGNTLELSEDETADYELGCEFTNAIVANWQRDNDIQLVKEGQRELRVWIHHPDTMKPLGSAKLDRHYLAPPFALIVDLKSGWTPRLSPAAVDWQLRFQAVGLWREFEDLGITTVRAGFAKPKSKYGSEDVTDYALSDLQMSEQSLLYHLWESDQKNAPLSPGEHCFYCPCRAFCPAAGAFAMMTYAEADKQIGRVDKAEAGDINKWVQSLSLEQVFRIWDSSTIIDRIVEAADARLKNATAEELAQLGLELPERGAKNDEILDTRSAFEYLRERNWNEALLWNALSFHRGLLVDLCMAERQLNKKLAAGWIDENLNPFIERKFKKPSLRRLK